MTNKNSRNLEKKKVVHNPFLENTIHLFGCGHCRIFVCQHHMENYSIRQTQEEMRNDKGTNRD